MNLGKSNAQNFLTSREIEIPVLQPQRFKTCAWAFLSETYPIGELRIPNEEPNEWCKIGV
jgi:hypothetical protein